MEKAAVWQHHVNLSGGAQETNHPFYQDAHPTVKQLNSNNAE
jgi:hypothetical protein